MSLSEISVERLLEHDIPELVGYNHDIVMLNNVGDMALFSHPVRLRATTVLICLNGEIDCNINMRNYVIGENQIMVNFSGDIIRINHLEGFAGYVLIMSEEYLQQIQLDFRFKVQSFISLHNNGPIKVPYEELVSLKPYYTLFKKNMEEDNSEAVKGLTIAVSHSIIAMIRRFQPQSFSEQESGGQTRAQQLFDKFMRFLKAYHTKERSLKFYAEKMCLTPKYLSGAIKSYSGKAPLTWINEYVVLEAEMMLRYTDMSVQEIAYALNFPTQSAFGKYFRQMFGISPKQYRNQD